jgi:hypothetical protein
MAVSIDSYITLTDVIVVAVAQLVDDSQTERRERAGRATASPLSEIRWSWVRVPPGAPICSTLISKPFFRGVARTNSHPLIRWVVVRAPSGAHHSQPL